MIEIRPREPVVLASDFSPLVAWYQEALGFGVTPRCLARLIATLTVPSTVREDRAEHFDRPVIAGPDGEEPWR